MINVSSSTYAEEVLSDERQFLLKARIGTEELVNHGGGRVLTGNHEIVSMTLEECAEAQDYQSLGNFCSSKLTMVLYDPDAQKDYYEGCAVCAYCGVRTAYAYDEVNEADYEMIPLGVFFVTDVVRAEGNLGKVTLTAYDKACFLEDICQVSEAELLAFANESIAVQTEDSIGTEGTDGSESGENVNVKVEDVDIALVIRYIVQQKKLTLENDELPETPLPAITQGLTYRQMLAYLAGLMGCNVRFNRENKLEFYWYQDTEYEIKPEQQYYSEFLPKLKAERRVTSLLCACGSQTFSRGEGEAGTCIQFENPMMTEEMMDAVWRDKVATVSFEGEGENPGESTFDADFVYLGEEDSVVVSATYQQREAYFQSTELSGLIVPEDETPPYGDYIFLNGVYRVDNILEEGQTEADNPVPEGLKVVVEDVSEDGSNFSVSLLKNIVVEIVNGETVITESEVSYEFQDGQKLKFTRIKQWYLEEGKETLTFDENERIRLKTDKAVVDNLLDGEIVFVRKYSPEGDEYYFVSETEKKVVVAGTVAAQISCAREIVTTDKICYLPAELKWRGNPALESGDIVKVLVGDKSYSFYIMEQVLQLGGGIYSKIICKGETEVSSNFSSFANNGVGTKIDKVYTSLQESITEATESIAGQTGGNVLLRKNEEGTVELLVFDGETLESSMNVWRWNAAGLGFSPDGCDGPFDIAITADGKIHAERLIGGSVEGGTLHIGQDDVKQIIEGINSSLEGENKATISAAAIKLEETGESLDEVITMEAYKGGGYNMICNSSGLFGFDGWEVTGTVDTEVILSGLGANSAFLIQAGGELLSKTTDVAISMYLASSTKYTLAARVKGGGKGVIQVESCDGDCIYGRITIDGTETDWTLREAVFVPESRPDMKCRVRVQCESGTLYVGDLILNKGLQTMWSPYPGEMYGTTVQISPFGIKVNQVERDTTTVIDASGTTVYNTTTETPEEVAIYTSDGVETKTLVSKGQVAAGRTRMIPRDDEQMIIWVINDDTEVEL